MEQKLSKLLDDITDEDGSINIPRAQLEYLIYKYGHDQLYLKRKEKKAFLIGLFWGSVFVFFGSVIFFKIIDFL